MTPDTELCLPLHKRVVTQYAVGESGAREPRLHFLTRLAKRTRHGIRPKSESHTAAGTEKIPTVRGTKSRTSGVWTLGSLL